MRWFRPVGLGQGSHLTYGTRDEKEYYSPMRFLILPAVVVASAALAQTPAPLPRAAAPPAVVSPEVLSDHSVVFRLRAPKASEVTLTGDFPVEGSLPVKMVKGEDGVWTYTAAPLPPDVYSYIFAADGVRFPDPVNRWLKPGNPPMQSMFRVPGGDEELMEQLPVPHGEVRVVYYRAKAVGGVRRMHVYLPPDYENGKIRYPVAYLFHGGGEQDFGWVDIGRVNFILDNLIARGKAKPMIVVMPDLYVLGPPEPAGRAEENDALLGKDLVEDMIPYVEAHYRALPGAANRAMGGLGVGREMVPDVFWPHMDTFNTVFLVAGGTEADRFEYMQKKYPGVLDNPANTKRVKFFLGIGDNDHGQLASRTLAGELERRGYAVKRFEPQGTHGWPAFRRNFIEWAQGAFR